MPKNSFQSFSNYFKTIFTLFGVFVLCFSLVVLPVKSNSWETKYDAEEAEISENLRRIQNDFDEIASGVGHFGSEEETLKEQVAVLKNEIDEIDNLVTETKIENSKLELKIQEKDKEVKQFEETLKNLFRQNQVRQNQGILGVILSSENLGDALSKIRNFSRLQAEVNALSVELAESRQDLEEMRSQLEETREILERSKGLSKSKRDSLEYIIQITEGEEEAYQDLLKTLKEQQTELNSRLEQNERAREDERNQVENGVRDNQNPLGPGCVRVETKEINVPDGYFVSPAEGWFTQAFHCYHDAIDIANAMGTEIKASAKGTVYYKGYMVGGYGHYIVLKHNLPSGDVLFTVYAHLQTESFRNEGEYVNQSDVIGYMGCTGNTRPRPCGVHLHFAVVSDTNEGIGYIGCLAHASRNCFDPLKSPINIRLD